MLKALAISNYRSLLNLVVRLKALNVITGPNGSGKSNVYRGLRLLAESASGRLIGCIAAEGGLQSALWAGPQSRTQSSSEPMPEDSTNARSVRLQLGFASDDFSYSIDLGLPIPYRHQGVRSAFALDPVIKRECVWLGETRDARSLCADRKGGLVRCRNQNGQWTEVATNLSSFKGLMSLYSDPVGAPELVLLQSQLQRWRFYDYLRTDPASPARQVQVGTRTPYLAHDGSNLAAALQTIVESSNSDMLVEAIEHAFPHSRLDIECVHGRFEILMAQPGMRRALTARELSEGTLRFLMLAAALLAAEPPELLVLNEPETHLHSDLLPSLARLIDQASRLTQVIVVTHSAVLRDSLVDRPNCENISLEKDKGSTRVVGQGILQVPPWKWPTR